MAENQAKFWLNKIRQLSLPKKIRIMNVCGGHERSITLAGLRNALPDNVELIPGPGCPVCICPEEDVHEAIQIALNESVILVAFGDMLRVPVNGPKKEPRSLDEAKALGADIRPISSPTEAVKIAQQSPEKSVVFFAAGFETTSSPVAAMLAEGAPSNLTVLLSGRLTWPAVEMLLASDSAGFECLVAPGHVSTVMGSDEWKFVVEKYHIPTAVAGFNAESLLAAFYSVLRQHLEGKVFLDNCYQQLVSEKGNSIAQKHLYAVFDVVDSNWRGIGVIPSSGYAINEKYSIYDARLKYPQYRDLARKRAGEMPPGCDCAKVVLGKIYPDQCRLFGVACTPKRPVGPCMVSDEGACRLWWSSGVREPRVTSESNTIT